MKNTDLDRFIKLYKSFGIDCIVFEPDGLIKRIQFQSSSNGNEDENDTVSYKFDGYIYLYSTIDFDMDGKFLEQGFWETTFEPTLKLS